MSFISSPSQFDSLDYAHSLKLVQACSLEKSSRSAVLSEGNSKIKCEFSYGSFPRPLESYFVSCSWCIHSDLVCNFLLTLLNIAIASGTSSVDSRSIGNGDVLGSFWYLKRKYAHREGELQLEHYMQNHTCGVDIQYLVLTAIGMISVIDLYAAAQRVLQSSSHVATHMRNMKRNGLFTAVVQLAMFLFINVLQPHASQGEFFPKPACNLLKSSYGAITARKFTLTLLKFGLLWCKHGYTLIELSQDTSDLISQTSRYHQFVGKFIALKAPHVTQLFATSNFLHFLKTDSRYVSAYWVTKQQEKVHRKSEEAERTSLDRPAKLRLSLLWFALGFLDVQQVVKQFQCCLKTIQSHDVAAAYVSNKLIPVSCIWNLLGYLLHTVMLNAIENGEYFIPWTAFDIGYRDLTNGQSQTYELHGKIMKAYSGWFGSLLGFLYGSLPRPPESSFCKGLIFISAIRKFNSNSSRFGWLKNTH